MKYERLKIAEIEDKNKVKILVSLEENIKHKLYNYSKENNYSYSDVVSLAVIEYLKNKIWLTLLKSYCNVFASMIQIYYSKQVRKIIKFT